VDPAVDGGTGSAGPDGNRFGRLPLYNTASTIGLRNWGGSGDVLESYSIAYAFGAWLARNYGGAELFEHLIADESPGATDMIRNAIFDTTNQAGVTMEDLLMQWGAAVVLSDDPTQLPPTRLNAGGWITSETTGLESYDLGSINHFNYDPELAPVLNTGLPAVSVTPLPALSKVIYRVGTNLSGVVELEINAEPGTDFAVVVK
jgi:hypothetical protein